MTKNHTFGFRIEKAAAFLRSRLPVLAAFAVVGLILSIGAFFFNGDIAKSWHLFLVPAVLPSFGDLRTVTHSIDCVLAGQDPYAVRSFDPWQRLYNYPSIWLDLRYLGVTSRSTNLIGIIFLLMMMASLLLLFKAEKRTCAIVTFLAVLSWPVMFAMERGNIDQVVFTFLVFGFFFIERQNAKIRPYLIGALIVFLTVLKIYPVVASIVQIKNRKGALIALMTGILSVAGLILVNGKNVFRALANTPHITWMSFGAYPFFLAISRHLPHFLAAAVDRHDRTLPSIAALVLAILSIMAGAKYKDRLYRFVPPLDFNRAVGCIAICCLAIYCFVFLSGSNFDYRLIFLTGVLAYLIDHMNGDDSLRSLPAAILFLLFCTTPSHTVFIHELLDGTVFILASAWLGTSLLDRIRITS